jgi:hypothetical protein
LLLLLGLLRLLRLLGELRGLLREGCRVHSGSNCQQSKCGRRGGWNAVSQRCD